MKVYVQPAGNLRSGRFFINSITQYAVDFSQCPNANPFTHNQILEVIDSHTFRLEFCSNFDVSPGTVVGFFQCFETGSKVFSQEVISSSPSSHLTCSIGDTDFIMTMDIGSSLPETCTISHAGVGSEIAC